MNNYTNNTTNNFNKIKNDIFENNSNYINKLSLSVNQIKLIEESFEHKHKECIELNLEVNKTVKVIKEEINKIIINQ